MIDGISEGILAPTRISNTASINLKRVIFEKENFGT